VHSVVSQGVIASYAQKLNVHAVCERAASGQLLFLGWYGHVITGTKYGCGVAQCGACTVHIDGMPTRRCVRPVSSVSANEKIVTIEGLPPYGSHPLQKAWLALDVAQCGFCQRHADRDAGCTAMVRSAPSLKSFNLL